MGSYGSTRWAIKTIGHLAAAFSLVLALKVGPRSSSCHLSGDVDHLMGIIPCNCGYHMAQYSFLDPANHQDDPHPNATCDDLPHRYTPISRCDGR